MDQWTSLQLAIQQQSNGVLSHQPYNYSAVFIDPSNLNNKPPQPIPPTLQDTDSGNLYEPPSNYHHVPVSAANPVAASLQVTCDKVTHQLSMDADAVMQQMSKYVEDAKHHFRMTVFSLGKHLRDSVIHPQQIYTETNPQFPQVCYNVSWEIVKSAQTVSFELTKSLDSSGKELVQAARNAARQLGVDIPDFTLYGASDHTPQQPEVQPSQPQPMLPPIPDRGMEETLVTDTTPINTEHCTPLDSGHISDDTEYYYPGPPSASSMPQSTETPIDSTQELPRLPDVSKIDLSESSCTVPLNQITKQEAQKFDSATENESQRNNQNISEGNSESKQKPRRGRKKTYPNASSKGPFPCDLCEKVFLHQKSHRIHMMRIHTGERPYKCETCGKQFVRAYELKNHKQTHTGQRQYKCDQCPKEFYRKKSYEFHIMKRHSNSRPFVCTTCGSGFIRACYLWDHMLIHTNEKKFICEYCDRAFLREKYLIQHRTIHTGEKPHACKICGERFKSMYYVLRHTKKHQSDMEGKAICHHCDKTFDKDKLVEHVKSHAEEKQFKCDVCEKVFFKIQELFEHRKEHLGHKPFVCMNKCCDKAFDSSAALERHTKTHGIKKRVAKPKFINKYVLCDTCGKSVQKGRLQTHLNTHKGEKPHKCDKCPKEYYVKKSLQIHQMVKHGGFKPFVCEECGKRFPTNYDLKQHLLVHDKRHKCDICDRAFTGGKLLIEHMTIHTGEKPFACKLCTDAFARYAHLAKHCKVVHRQLISGRKLDSGHEKSAKKNQKKENE